MVAAHLHAASVAGGPYADNFSAFAGVLHNAYGEQIYVKKAWWLSTDSVKSYIRSIRVIHGSD